MKKYIPVLLLLLPLASCNKQVEPAPERSTAFVSIKPFGTKAQIGTNTLLCWSGGDKIAIVGDDADKPSEFTLRSGSGYSVASFEGVKPEGGSYIVCYPPDARCDGETFRASLSTFVNHAVPNQPLGILPMWGRSRDLSSVTLGSPCGILKLELKGEGNLKSITLDAGKPISGEFLYNITADLFAMIGGANIITMYASDTELLPTRAVPFYFILPPGEYDELVFNITDSSDDETYITVDDAVEIEAGTFSTISYDLTAI